MLPLTAANQWPPVEKRHSGHPLIANSLYGRMSSISRFISRSLSLKPHSTWSPDGWKAIERHSSEKTLHRSVLRST